MSYTPRLDSNGIPREFPLVQRQPILSKWVWYAELYLLCLGAFLGNRRRRQHRREQANAITVIRRTVVGFPTQLLAVIIKRDKFRSYGAVACFYDNNGGAGHVAIVEEIDANGNITCSNSAWQSTYFYLTNLQANNNYSYSHFTFQGFIYNPYSDQPLPLSSRKKRKFPWAVFINRIRE